mgnify:CR=1 FL=1
MLKRFFIGSASIYSNFSTISKYRRTYVWCILPIILLVNFSPIIAETVNTPGSIKTLTAIPRQEWSKSSNGRLELWEYAYKITLNIGRPIGRGGIKSFEFGQKNIAEGSRSVSKAISSIVKAGEISRNSSHDKSANNLPVVFNEDINQVVHKFVIGLWIGLIVSFLCYFFEYIMSKISGVASPRSLY